MDAIFKILAMFSGPLGQLLLSGITSGGVLLTTYLTTKVGAGPAEVIASGLVTALSAGVQAMLGAKTTQIKAVNMTDNGVRVVPTEDAKAAGIPAVQEPLK